MQAGRVFARHNQDLSHPGYGHDFRKTADHPLSGEDGRLGNLHQGHGNPGAVMGYSIYIFFEIHIEDSFMF